MADPQLKELITIFSDISKRSDRLMTAAENRLLRAFRQAEAKAFARMAQIAAEAPDLISLSLDARMAWYVENAAFLETAALESFPASAVADYVALYPQYAKFAEKALETGRISGGRVEIPKAWIDFLASRDANQLSDLTAGALQKLDDAFLQNVLVGVSRPGLLAELKGVITGSYPWGERRGLYEWHAGTYTRTFHHRAERIFHTNQAKELGLTKYLYLGPFDSKVRPFCQPLVGGVFTEEEINQMDNGQTGSGAGIILQDGGGWNCRHDWQALDDETAKMIEDDAKEAEAEVKKQAPVSPGESRA